MKEYAPLGPILRAKDTRSVFPEKARIVSLKNRQGLIRVQPDTWVSLGFITDTAAMEDTLRSHRLSQRTEEKGEIRKKKRRRRKKQESV